MPTNKSADFIQPGSAEMEAFTAHLLKSKRVLALCGAGLSASSGLSTFRGAGGLWKTHDAMSLATPEAFDEDPSLVWQFYAARRNHAFSAKPNLGHYALAEYARKNKEFITVTQNVDGLSPRARHPSNQLYHLHGLLSTIKCDAFNCTYVQENNYSKALTPALDTTSLSTTATDDDESQPTNIPISNLPHCPACKTGLLRPGVVWFGESLPEKTMKSIDNWLKGGKVDLCLVIGTSGTVYPAAGYVALCQNQGAKVAVVNLEATMDEEGLYGSDRPDWYFRGDAAKLLPEILKPVIGDIQLPKDIEDTFPEATSSGGPSHS